MAGLDPATQCASVRERKRVFRRTDVRRLGGRLKGGHGEVGLDVMTKDVLLAAVIGAHGLKGEVRVKTFTETPDALARYPRLNAKDGRVFTPARIMASKADEAIVTFAEIVDRNTAEGLKGLELFVAREALPATAKNEFYHADLIGLTAIDAADRVIGKVKAIHNYGAGDVIEIARESPEGRGGDTVMLPFARDFVPEIDLKSGRVVIAEPAEVDTGERGNVE
jgi:16S rRNA processing protein RimM